ncbi:alcohol acetyltransferase [Ruminiclostridium hungatei]|uniref:Alcohol acetyltransferase n=1 Tax=Ruminiclostridium hungatei TaxID=48256 RepID=A0A1V4SM85_RUMHU|nr:alcohol acetyltransferase [Ruminiclostridium hungatei]OPX44934.1 alcohol acetyltransferase [Ruminiclostridium hungatei]
MDRWFKIDNAGKIFRSVSNKSNTSIFRVAMIMTEPVQKDLLQEAVDIVIKRFPTLAVRLQQGVFWDFLDQNDKRLLVKVEEEYPCHPLKAEENNGYLIRVLYYNCRISVEIFHSLTDGTGAIEFIKTLGYQYLRLCGKDIEDEGLVLHPEELPNRYEMEDSFPKYYQPVQAKRQNEQRAFHIEGTLLEPFGTNTTHGVMSASGLNAIAKSSNATITEYLTAVLIHSIYSQNMKYGIYSKPIKVTIPVNLRRIFPSKTLRNFFTIVNVGVKPSEELSFEKILTSVSAELKEKTKKNNLNNVMASNIKLEKMLVARFVPVFIKNIFMRYGFENFGENAKTITLSNLGNTRLPSSMHKYVRQMEAIIYPTRKSPVNCGVCTVNDSLTVTFSRTIIDTGVIRSFFSFLALESGLEIKVYSNKWGKSL